MGQIQSTTPQVDAPLIEIAKDQADQGFSPIIAAVVHHPAYRPAGYDGSNTLLLAFRPDEHQRRAIEEGADIYVSLLTFGQPMHGIIVMAGKKHAGAIYNVRTTEDEQAPAPALAAPTGTCAH